MPERIRHRSQRIAAAFDDLGMTRPHGLALQALGTMLRGETPRYVELVTSTDEAGRSVQRVLAVAWTTLARVTVTFPGEGENGGPRVGGSCRALADVHHVRMRGGVDGRLQWRLVFPDGDEVDLPLAESPSVEQLERALDVADMVVQKWDHADDPVA